MRILHISDVHCAVARLREVLESEAYDVVAATGDFECESAALELLDRARAPVLAVTGNMDHAGVARILRDAGSLIDGEVVEVSGFRFAGVGGLDVKSSLEKLRRRLGGSGVDVLLSHHPPKGAVDRSFIGLRIGLQELRALDEDVRPRLHLCGHVHESRGVERLGATVVVNPGPLKSGYYALIDVGPGGVSVKPARL